MKMLIAALLTIGSAFASGFPDGNFVYRYELVATGTAPDSLSIEGSEAKLKKDCHPGAVAGTVECRGMFHAISILPHGIVFIRGPVTSDRVSVKIYQRCGKKTEREVTGLGALPIRSNPLEGLFYLEPEAYLDPCRLL